MQRLTRIIKARWIIPIVPSHTVLEHHAVLVHDGVIVDIVPQHTLSDAYQADEVVDLEHHILMPGLVNLHGHSAMTLLRGYADDVALMDWLTNYIWPAEQQWVSAQFVHDGSLLACAEMLKGGITTLNDMYFYPQSTIDATLRMGLRAHIGMVVIDVPTNYASNAQDYIRQGTQVRDANKHHSHIHFSFAPHAPYTVSDDTFTQIVTLSEQLDIGIHTHLHETEAEIQQSLQQFGVRPLSRMQSLGVLGPNTVLAHCVHMQAQELETLASMGCHIAHCPSSNLKLASGLAPIQAAIEAGVNVGLGTDGASSNNRLDMLRETHTAAMLAKVQSNNPLAVTAFKALEIATINGAKALGMDAIIGSLSAGKQADLVAIRVDDVDLMPMYDVISHVVYVAGREHVSHVWVGGELKYQQTVDASKYDKQQAYAQVSEEELVSIAQQWQLKLNTFKQSR